MPNNKTLYAIVLLQTPKGKTKIGVVPCENSVFKRLIEIPTRPGTFMLCEELILHFVYRLFAKYTISEKTVIRVTRNADIDTENFSDDHLDYRDMMGKLIKKRTRLDPVRVEITRDINNKMKVGLLTSGGDCQALNAAMRGVVKALYEKTDNVEIFGFELYKQI